MSSGPLEPLCRRLGIHHPTFSVTILQFGSCLVATVFQFYYVKVFLNHYKISEEWFQTAQVLFMVWNALNDPLFGLFQDLGGGWMRSRKRVILYSGPFYALFFLLFWFPWGDSSWLVGVHLIVSLFLYDGIFSFALLAWCALFAEITTDHASRVRAMKYMQISILLGVNSIVVAEKVSSSLANFQAFQFTCVVFAVICVACCTYTGLYAPGHAAQTELVAEDRRGLIEEASQDDDQPHTWGDAWRIVKQIVVAPDFQRITAANFLHTCRSTLHLNFAAIFTEGIVPRSLLPLGSWQISVFYGACALLPQILVITYSSILNRYGFYKVLQSSFVVSTLAGLLALLLSSSAHVPILAFMLLDSILVHTFSPLMTLLFADFIDDDMQRYKRRSPMSSLVFSMNALFTKPAQSLAPMVAVFFLNQAHYEEYNDKKISPDQMTQLQGTMFGMLCLSPAILGALQFLVFRSYTLRTKHKEDPADQLAKFMTVA